MAAPRIEWPVLQPVCGDGVQLKYVAKLLNSLFSQRNDQSCHIVTADMVAMPPLAHHASRSQKESHGNCIDQSRLSQTQSSSGFLTSVNSASKTEH